MTTTTGANYFRDAAGSEAAKNVIMVSCVKRESNSFNPPGLSGGGEALSCKKRQQTMTR